MNFINNENPGLVDQVSGTHQPEAPAAVHRGPHDRAGAV